MTPDKETIPFTAWAICLCLLLLTACDDDSVVGEKEKSEPQLLLRVIMPRDYPSDSTRYWAMIHDAAGILLDASPIASGDTLKFMTDTLTVAEDLQFTLLSMDTVGATYGAYTYFFQSYAQIKVASELILKPTLFYEAPSGITPGTYKVTVSDVSSLSSASISSKMGGSSFEWSWGEYTLQLNGYLYFSGLEHLLSIEDGNGFSQYRFIDQINDNDHIVLSGAELQPADSYADISFPIYPDYLSAQVLAFDNDTPIDYRGGYTLLQSFRLMYGQTSRVLPYLNRFTRYRTNVQIKYGENMTLNYLKDGAPPIGPITLSDDMKMGILNRSFSGFQVSAESPYAMRESNFSYHASQNNKDAFISWTVYSPQGDRKPLEIPSKLLARYPVLDLAMLNHVNTRFYLQGRTYSDFIDQRFQGTMKPEADEYFATDISH